MIRFFVVRMDAVPEHREALRSWLVEEHLPGGAAVPGLSEGAVCYEAIETPTAFRTYPPNPEFTAVFPLERDISVVELVDSSAFHDWWLGSVTTRFRWVARHKWVVCEQRLGPERPFAHARILFTEVDVAPGHEQAWGEWYDRFHVHDALAVPGLFGEELRRFESIDVWGDRWHSGRRPRFMQLLPIADGADILASTGTPEFLALAASTQAAWAGAFEFLSTICIRVDSSEPIS